MKMKDFNILLKILIFINFYMIPALALITCPKEFLYQIGVNATCESKDKQTIPCDGSHPLHIQTAYIDCTEEYFNHKTHESIFCDTERGIWSPQPLRCFRHCDKSGTPEKIEILSNKTEYPWYAEILKKNPTSNDNDDRKEIIPGLIMTARMIMTWEKYFDKKTDWNLTDYIVRIYDPPNHHEDFNIERIEYVSSDPVYNIGRTDKYDPFCVLILTNDNYIKINDKDTRPPCLDHELFENNNWFVEVVRAIPENNLRPNYPNKCLVPKLDDKNVEVTCYQNFKSKPLDKCPDKVPILQTKCKLGYEKINSTNDDPLSTCIANRWSINDENENENCELICGETDTENDSDNEKQHSEIKKAPWHVAIYSNKTRSILSAYDQFCSGVIIDQNIILSAAHCFYDKEEKRTEDPTIYLIAAGKSFHSFKEKEDSEQYVHIKEIHIPTTYGKDNDWSNDIAVLILNSSLTFNSYVKPICIDLNSESELKTETSGHIFGWRATTKDDIINNNLQILNVTALTGEQCKIENNKDTNFKSGNFCIAKKISPTLCKGDTGGGFFVKENINDKERYILKGIISSDINRGEYCSNNSLTILTDLQYVKDFVRKTVTENRQKLDEIEIINLIWYRIYAHGVWTTPNWIRKELNLTFSENPKTRFYDSYGSHLVHF
ncbi:uncharacterized protein LOC129613230 [Condylostylus longicornis]|uniref:uncharacterized protein LOC129613230 n=1 Tax=Condylostylus longicornis TaxID=2530218 RepID=UPI00244E191A|nr:uncharacterized protein LOC129613230 [Condylostylus longicornis]